MLRCHNLLWALALSKRVCSSRGGHPLSTRACKSPRQSTCTTTWNLYYNLEPFHNLEPVPQLGTCTTTWNLYHNLEPSCQPHRPTRSLGASPNFCITPLKLFMYSMSRTSYVCHTWGRTNRLFGILDSAV